MDAYLTAFAYSAGIELVTLDRGFLRYEKSGLRLKLIETTAS